MVGETIGEVYAVGWRVAVRCSYGRSDSPSSRSSRECNYRKDLDMETLVWTRGQGVSAFAAGKPVALPALRFTRCGGAVSAANLAG
jgi:hypothetical protein